MFQFLFGVLFGVALSAVLLLFLLGRVFLSFNPDNKPEVRLAKQKQEKPVIVATTKGSSWTRVDNESASWVNVMVHRVFDDVIAVDELTDTVAALLEKKVGELDIPALLGAIKVTSIDLGKLPPKITSVQSVQNNLNEVSYEFELTYNGEIGISIQTQLNVNWPHPMFATLPVELGLVLNSFCVTVRIDVEGGLDPKWRISLSHVPEYDLDISSIVGYNNQIKNVDKIADMIKTQIKSAIEKHKDLTMSFHLPLFGRKTRIAVE